jgi:hypothetical protein
VVPAAGETSRFGATALTAHPGRELRRIGGRLSLARQAAAAYRTRVNNAECGRVTGQGRTQIWLI